jgi:hypothetical protein
MRRRARRSAQPLGGAVRIRFQFFLASVVLVGGCSKGGDFPVAAGRCENRRPSEFVSPDRLYKAIQFSRRCGSDLPSLNVSVLPISVPLPDEPGNVLIDVPPKDIGGYTTRIKVIWSEEHQLTIEHNDSMKLERAATSAGDLQIVQRTVPDNAA